MPPQRALAGLLLGRLPPRVPLVRERDAFRAVAPDFIVEVDRDGRLRYGQLHDVRFTATDDGVELSHAGQTVQLVLGEPELAVLPEHAFTIGDRAVPVVSLTALARQSVRRALAR